MKRFSTNLQRWLRIATEIVNQRFNSLPETAKRVLVILIGITVGVISLIIIINAIRGESESVGFSDSTSERNENHMQQKAEDLIPIGKMKGEMNGEFEAFYLAVDLKGQLYINYSPSYSKDTYSPLNGWQQITRSQLEPYERQLKFFPTKKNQLKV